MKSIVLFITGSVLTLSTFCQTLQGQWVGSFVYHIDRYHINNYPITLDITLNSDSTYNIRSHFKGLTNDNVFTTITSSIMYKVISPDSIIMQELRILNPANGAKHELKKMYLKY